MVTWGLPTGGGDSRAVRPETGGQEEHGFLRCFKQRLESRGQVFFRFYMILPYLTLFYLHFAGFLMFFISCGGP